MHHRLRKSVGLVLFLIAGALFTLLIFILKWRIAPNEFSATQLIGFSIGLLIILIVLTIIYFQEWNQHEGSDE